MKKKVIMAGAAVIMSAVAVGFSANTNNKMTDLMSANLEALTGDEIDKDYNFAKNIYCTVPAGEIGCKSALTRKCTIGVFCDK